MIFSNFLVAGPGSGSVDYFSARGSSATGAASAWAGARLRRRGGRRGYVSGTPRPGAVPAGRAADRPAPGSLHRHRKLQPGIYSSPSRSSLLPFIFLTGFLFEFLTPLEDTYHFPSVARLAQLARPRLPARLCVRGCWAVGVDLHWLNV